MAAKAAMDPEQMFWLMLMEVDLERHIRLQERMDSRAMKDPRMWERLGARPDGRPRSIAGRAVAVAW